MSKQVKRVRFAKNNYGLYWMDINTHSWEIVGACGAGRHLIGRACRMSYRGETIEYRDGTRYIAINAKIEMMG